MSWDGTVRCSHCWEKGHNKRSCPQLKERLEEQARAGDKYAEQRLRQSQTKKCSYCQNSYHTDDPLKHNARTCKWRIKHEREIVNETIERRKEIYARMQEAGFNVGTLVEWDEQSWSDAKSTYITKPQLAIVEQFQWQDVTSRTRVALDNYYDYVPSFRGTRIGGSSSGKPCSVTAPPSLFDLDEVLSKDYQGDANSLGKKNNILSRNSTRLVAPLSLDNPSGIPEKFTNFKLVAREKNIRELVDNKGANNTWHALDREGPPEE